MEYDEGASLTQSFKRRRKEIQKNIEPWVELEEPSGTTQDPGDAKLPDTGERFPADAQPEILVSEFDYSVENHFKFVDAITEFCEYPGTLEADQAEIKRFSNSITFLREWRDFNYKPRVVKFACQNNSEEKDVIGCVTMSQFAAACIPKKGSNESGIGAGFSKDFIMNVGGTVSALDWCPRVDIESENCIKCEFVAVAAHPPDSYYHKIGAPLTGRGAIQIWCLLNAHAKDGLSQGNNKSRPNFRNKATVTSNGLTKVLRPRGRPRKEPLIESVENIDAGDVNKPKAGKGDKIHNIGLPFLRRCEHGESALEPLRSSGFSVDSASPDKTITCITSAEAYSTKNSIPIDVALPRMMMCLAHNGKVAWDVKWRPVDAYHPNSIYMMGYLAVLLGNGALEVWKVPLPHTVKLAYPTSQECIDPRFIKLQPVFRCSMLKCGDRRSIPLTVEWSVSSPHDLILAGCHDGVVALWKFSVSDSLTETRPLLSFSADTGPIRTLAWAPNQSDLANANIIVTAGQKGSKFWDIRDPFRPLSEHPIPVVTYCLDWLSNPRCVFGSTEDGTVWLINLEKAAHDLPLSEKCHYMASKHGFHCFDCSPFSLWSLQASRLTGMVAYCGEEGSTLCFQPTTRSLKDPSRYRVHHYLCGSLLEEENAIIVATPIPNSSFQVRFPGMKRTPSVKEQERRAKQRMNKSATADEQALGGTENAELREEVGRGEKGEQFEVFPAKELAMHKVRWNVNKGSEKWLCYGGAAGLVRCQEVDFGF